MASSDRWLSGVDLGDVTLNITAFEVMSNCKIELCFTAEDNHGRGQLWVGATAFTRPPEGMDRSVLASVRSSVSGLRVRSLEAAVIHTLYLLDGALGRKELRGES